MRVLALEAYYGGSHRAFVDIWARYSIHEWSLKTLPARHWKWRMRGSALWFAEALKDAPAGRYDVVLTSDMTSVADLRALLPAHLARLPLVCYFHENQLTYPLSPTDWRDYQYGFTNITSGLASEAVWFNSQAHRGAFLEAADRLLRRMSDYVPREAIAALERSSTVRYPAVEGPPGKIVEARKPRTGPLRILWSHRWEYDKNPHAFFEAMLRLDEAGVNFQLVLVGEQFRTAPPDFLDAHRRLKRRVAHTGYLESRAAYWQMISSCDVVVSTALQENFGLAVVEAMLAGCYPLLPDRLSYPELLPPAIRALHLYEDNDELFDRLASLAGVEDRELAATRASLAQHLRACFGAESQVPRLDAALAEFAESVPQGS